MKKDKLSPMLALLVCLVLTLFLNSSAYSVTFNVVPERILVNSLYHGSEITVSGESEAGEDIIIKFSSPEKKVHLRRKGKSGGLLWMNVGEIKFNPVSDVYLLYSTQDIDRILSDEQQDKYSLGYDSFKRLVEVSPVRDESEKKKWVDEFLLFREKNRAYGEFKDKIDTAVEGDKQTFELTVDWPYQAPPQEYIVRVFAVKDNMVREYRQTPLVVETVGALKFISGMAFDNASLYGIASIFIAIAAGFIVSIIFKGGGGSH